MLTIDQIDDCRETARKWRALERAATIEQIAAADTPPLCAVSYAHALTYHAVPELALTALTLMQEIVRLRAEAEVTNYKLEVQRQINDGLAKAVGDMDMRRPVIYIFPKGTLSAERLAQLREEGEVRGA